jgi:hypothetical protein
VTLTCANARCPEPRFAWTQAPEGGRPPDYCSDACRNQAFYWRAKARHGRRYAAVKGYRRKGRAA